MELREYLAIVRRRFWILLTVPTVAALTAALLSLYAIAPVYEAGTTLWVVKQEATSIDYNTLLLNRNLVKTYGEVAKSRAVLQAVIRTLGLPETVETLQKRVRITPIRDTEIIGITVEDGDPERAAAIANATAAAFMNEIKNFIRLDNVRVVDPAVVPHQPVKPRPLLNTAIALMLGLMTALGLAFLLEYMDVTIRTPEDVERHLGVPVIGIIPVIESVKATEELRTGAGAPLASRRRRRAATIDVTGGEGK